MGLQGSIAETGDLIFATQNRQHESQVIGLEKVYSAIRPLSFASGFAGLGMNWIRLASQNPQKRKKTMQ